MGPILLRVWSATLAGAALLAAPVHAGPLYQWTWVVPEGVFEANGGPAIAELPDRTLIACWPGGTLERARDVQIYCSHSPRGDPKWESPVAVVKRDERPPGWLLPNRMLANPVLFLDRQRRLWLFYSAVDVPLFGWSGAHVDYKVSEDFGRSWSPGRRLIWAHGNLTRNRALELAPDRILLPVYHELFGTHGYVLTLRLGNGRIELLGSERIPGRDHIQPSLVLTKDRRLFAYMRTTTTRIPYVLFSEYNWTSGGWTPPIPLGLPNPKSALDVLKAEDGKILMVFNDTPDYRSPLSLAYSEDGRRFTKIWDFETDPKLRFSYPTLIRTLDGLHHLVYRYDGLAIKHVAFNREWLEARIQAAGPR